MLFDIAVKSLFQSLYLLQRSVDQTLLFRKISAPSHASHFQQELVYDVHHVLATSLARKFSRFEYDRTLLDVDEDGDYKTGCTKH